MNTTAVLIVIGIFFLLFMIIVYNRLVALKNRLEEAWFQIDVQLKRRADLIPNLVETVKGYATHESKTLEKVIQARSMLQQAGKDVNKVADANNELTSALKSLFAIVEGYPDLKANQNFLNLQIELAGIEDKIAYARQFYNETVRMYNEFQQIFPANLFAGIFGFKPAQYFEITNLLDKLVPNIKF
ncbi:MAG: LemA family protein [Candidatus Goldbacteria bacterium]|nr:LemA family protein [Candidatus Goldiibacteriota bacterium]